MKRKRRNLRRQFVFYVVILCGFFFFSCLNKGDNTGVLPFSESEHLSGEDNALPIIYVSTMDVAPFGFFTETGEPTGILVDIADYIGEKLNLSMVHQVVPFSRCMFDLETGAADLWMGFDNKCVKERAVRTGEFGELNTIVIGLAGTQFSSLNDLHGKTIATVQDAQYHAGFTNDTEIIKYSTQNYGQNFRMLLTGRVDGVIGPELGLYYILREMGNKRTQLGEPLYLETRMGYIFYSKKTLNFKVKAKIKALTTSQEYRDYVKSVIEYYTN